tara:strand:- start:1714 stop:2370 length:657 start_codon:yes stop_codon:yes gene_type:complete
MVKKKEETKIDPKKCKINYNYFDWTYYEQILKITTRTFLSPTVLSPIHYDRHLNNLFHDYPMRFKNIPIIQNQLIVLKNVKILHNIFKNIEIHYKSYKEKNLEILKKYSELIDEQYVLMKETEKGKKAINEINNLKNQIHILPFDKIDPKYFLFDFNYLLFTFNRHNSKSEENIELILKEPYFLLHTFDFLSDIFNMNILQNLKTDDDVLKILYSELE